VNPEHGWPTEVTWLFLSIGDAAPPREPAGWQNIIAAADSNNHSIPTIEEINIACGQLLGAGLIAMSREGVRLTESGSRLFAKVNARRVGHITRFVDLASEWREKAPIDAQPEPFEIQPEELGDAIERYNEWFDSAVQSMRDREKRLLDVLAELQKMHVRATGAEHAHLAALLDPKTRHHPRTLNYLVASAPGTLQDAYFSPENGNRVARDEVVEFNAAYRDLLDEAVDLGRKLMWPAATGRAL
jgi:hypothetical protein